MEDSYVNDITTILPAFNESKSSFINFKNKTIEYRDPTMISHLVQMSFTGSNGPVSQLKLSSTAGWVRENYFEPDSRAHEEHLNMC